VLKLRECAAVNALEENCRKDFFAAVPSALLEWTKVC
jgi:hypothetical protein